MKRLFIQVAKTGPCDGDTPDTITEEALDQTSESDIETEVIRAKRDEGKISVIFLRQPSFKGLMLISELQRFSFDQFFWNSD